jgi:hypothetical protein
MSSQDLKANGTAPAQDSNSEAVANIQPKVNIDSDYLKKARAFLSRTVSKTRYAAEVCRGLDFDITIDDVIKILIEQQGLCALTGEVLEFERGGTWRNGTNANACTMDRIYNSAGYKSWNIQLTCWRANAIRSSLTMDELKEFCQQVIEHDRRKQLLEA